MEIKYTYRNRAAPIFQFLILIFTAKLCQPHKFYNYKNSESETGLLMPIPIIDTIFDPIHQEELELDSETIRIVKSVFNLPTLLSTIGPIECPPGTRRITANGECILNAPKVSLGQNFLEDEMKNFFTVKSTAKTTTTITTTTTTTTEKRGSRPHRRRHQHGKRHTATATPTAIPTATATPTATDVGESTVAMTENYEITTAVEKDEGKQENIQIQETTSLDIIDGPVPESEPSFKQTDSHSGSDITTLNSRLHMPYFLLFLILFTVIFQ